MEINASYQVGQIATEYPLATRVFARHGIDYCCGGGREISIVCEEMGIETDLVLKEIENEIAGPDVSVVTWDKEPLPDLIDHILATHHVPLYEELERLEMMANKVAEVHGHKDPERIPELAKMVTAIKQELVPHMHKEEQILFPMIKSGRGKEAVGPITVMNHDHDAAGVMLKRIRELTDNFVVPEHACNTWRALWHGLEAFEEDIHTHIHLENNILFPRALAGN